MQNRRIIDGIFRSVGAQPVPAVETNSIFNLVSHVSFGRWSSIVPAPTAAILRHAAGHPRDRARRAERPAHHRSDHGRPRAALAAGAQPLRDGAAGGYRRRSSSRRALRRRIDRNLLSIVRNSICLIRQSSERSICKLQFPNSAAMALAIGRAAMAGKTAFDAALASRAHRSRASASPGRHVADPARSAGIASAISTTRRSR